MNGFEDIVDLYVLSKESQRALVEAFYRLKKPGHKPQEGNQLFPITHKDEFQVLLPESRYKTYSKVMRRSPDGRSFDGKLKIGSPPFFSEEYVSRVTVIPEALTIETQSIESNRFESLRSRWKLEEINNDNEDTQCDVNFEVEMTVSDPVIVSILDRVLEQVATRQVAAFEERCRELPLPYDLIEAAKGFQRQ